MQTDVSASVKRRGHLRSERIRGARLLVCACAAAPRGGVRGGGFVLRPFAGQAVRHGSGGGSLSFLHVRGSARIWLSMLFLNKRRVLAFAIVLCLLLLACVPLSALSRASLAAPFTVVIDAGHGGIDGGVVGVRTKVKESDLNLMIAQLLCERFEEAGFRAVLTRTNAGGLYGLPSAGYKRRDMERRREIIEEAAPNLVLSVHQNYFPSDFSRRGGQVFYRAGSEEGAALALCIQERLNALGGGTFSPLTGDYYMLNCTEYPSVIVECAFLSNAEDEALLLTEEYRGKIADAVFAGALAWLA